MGRSKNFSPFDIEMIKDDAEMMVDDAEMMVDDAEMMKDVHRRWIFAFGCVILASGEKVS